MKRVDRRIDEISEKGVIKEGGWRAEMKWWEFSRGIRTRCESHQGLDGGGRRGGGGEMKVIKAPKQGDDLKQYSHHSCSFPPSLSPLISTAE